jgi:plasmid maintenance system antidote protein VapI
MDWMDRRGLNQRETARSIAMNHTTLNHILTGRRSVGLAVAVRIEQLTGIPVEAWMPTNGGGIETAPVAVGRKRK